MTEGIIKKLFVLFINNYNSYLYSKNYSQTILFKKMKHISNILKLKDMIVVCNGYSYRINSNLIIQVYNNINKTYDGDHFKLNPYTFLLFALPVIKKRLGL